MDNRDPVWSFGESQLLYDPTSSLDNTWWFGESIILDEPISGATAGAGIHNPFHRTFLGPFGGPM